jgi:hypothetical protein
MHRPGGVRSNIVLLRPVEWLTDTRAEVGSSIFLDMPEMSCRGLAEVASIDACPEIESGGGRIVTGTFAHSSGDLLDIAVEGIATPISATAAHPIWSEDRQTFVPAGQLVEGERLRTLERLCHVIGITSRGPPTPVYNIEVSVDHTYLVTQSENAITLAVGFLRQEVVFPSSLCVR